MSLRWSKKAPGGGGWEMRGNTPSFHAPLAASERKGSLLRRVLFSPFSSGQCAINILFFLNNFMFRTVKSIVNPHPPPPPPPPPERRERPWERGCSVLNSFFVYRILQINIDIKYLFTFAIINIVTAAIKNAQNAVPHGV